MLAIIGTVPDADFPLVHGNVRLKDSRLFVGEHEIPVNRGTPALLAAAAKASDVLDGPDVYGFLAGDIGTGKGSLKLYKFLCEELPAFRFRTLTFHYLQPVARWHDRLLGVIERMESSPKLIADAGYMYVAKMCGQAGRYDLFTPDMGELAFLADEMAPHPFYTRGFILHNNEDAPELINRSYEHKNAARHMVVKGKMDYIVSDGKIIGSVDQPSHDVMEAIGGTGDTLTGLAAVLCSTDYSIETGSRLAAETNRWIGHYAKPNPATQVLDLINVIPDALSVVLAEYNKEIENP